MDHSEDLENAAPWYIRKLAITIIENLQACMSR